MPAGSAPSPARPARSRGSTPSTTQRTSRSTCSTSAATCLLCSPYKFCGPHLGIAYLRTEVAETWRPYKARPSSSKPLGRSFETGTLPYELLAGFQATIAYLDSLGGLVPLRDYERALGERFLAALPDSVTLYGPPTMEGRVPTFLLNVAGVDAETVARTLGERGLGVWYADNWYCVSLAEKLPPSVGARRFPATTTRPPRSTGSSKSSLRSESVSPARTPVGRAIRERLRPRVSYSPEIVR